MTKVVVTKDGFGGVNPLLVFIYEYNEKQVVVVLDDDFVLYILMSSQLTIDISHFQRKI